MTSMGCWNLGCWSEHFVVQLIVGESDVVKYALKGRHKGHRAAEVHMGCFFGEPLIEDVSASFNILYSGVMPPPPLR